MKDMGMSLGERFKEFPWMLKDLVFPFMMEYLVSLSTSMRLPGFVSNLSANSKLAWYLIWETVLNILAELTYFADRSFYDAWWNSGT